MPRSVFGINALREQKLFGLIRALENKSPFRGRLEHPVLYLFQFDLKDLSNLFFAERVKHDHLVQAVHEFGRELFPSGFHPGTGDFFRGFGIELVGVHRFECLEPEAETRLKQR